LFYFGFILECATGFSLVSTPIDYAVSWQHTADRYWWVMRGWHHCGCSTKAHLLLIRNSKFYENEFKKRTKTQWNN